MALFLNMRKISEVSVQLLVYGLLHMKWVGDDDDIWFQSLEMRLIKIYQNFREQRIGTLRIVKSDNAIFIFTFGTPSISYYYPFER